MTKSNKLRTSKAVFERIRWDPTFDSDGVVVIFNDRFLGEQARPFEAFDPDRVPYSRVVRFLRGDEVLWDRALRIDRVFGSGDTTTDETLRRRAKVKKVIGGRDCLEVGSLAFDVESGGWLAGSGEPKSRMRGPLRVVSFNVLHDTYDEGQLRSLERRPLLLSTLESLDADLIGLQEVTGELAETLMGLPWLRDHVISSGRSSNSPNGLMLISRFPLSRVVELRSGPRAYAHLAVASLVGISNPIGSQDESLVVGVVHLTSDRHKAAPEIRRRQIRTVLAAADELGQPGSIADSKLIVIGDFNFGDEHVEPELEKHRVWDAWPRLHGAEPGFTFDPPANAIAAANSTTGRARRLDRVFVAGISPADASLSILSPRDDAAKLDASDHFPLLLTLGNREELRAAKPTHRSALVILLPPSLQEDVQSRRLQSDRSFSRWMPHINLLYGFIPDDLFAQAAAITRDVLADVGPFETSLAELRSFEHGRSTTVWLDPQCQPQGSIQQLRARLVEAFPTCMGERPTFTPHLTVGQLRGGAQERAAQTLQEWGAALAPLRFTVESVALISRSGDEPFEVRHTVPLGARRIDQPPVDSVIAGLIRGGERLTVASAEEVVEVLQRALCGTSFAGASVHLVGSSRYADRLEGADVDVVVCTDSDSELGSALWEIAAALKLDERVTAARVAKAIVPSVRARVLGRALDILVADESPATESAHSAIALAEWFERTREQLGTRFVVALRALKLWTSRRAVSKQALGFPGGVGWALLAVDAFARIERRPIDAADLLRTILGGIRDQLANRKSPLPSPVPPYESVLRTLSANGRRIAIAELDRSLKLLAAENGSWNEAFAPASPWADPSAVTIELDCESSDEAAGWLCGVALGAIERLLDAGAVRPYLVSADKAAHRSPALVLGLDTAEIASSALERVESHLERGPTPPGPVTCRHIGS